MEYSTQIEESIKKESHEMITVKLVNLLKKEKQEVNRNKRNKSVSEMMKSRNNNYVIISRLFKKFHPLSEYSISNNKQKILSLSVNSLCHYRMNKRNRKKREIKNIIIPNGEFSLTMQNSKSTNENIFRPPISKILRKKKLRQKLKASEFKNSRNIELNTNSDKDSSKHSCLLIQRLILLFQKTIHQTFIT